MSTEQYGQWGTQLLALFSVGFLAVWPLAVNEYDVPLVLGAVLWGGVLFLLFWFVVRPFVLPSGSWLF